MTGSDQREPGWRLDVGDDCMSSQQCILTAPDLFALDADGFSHAVNEWVSDGRGEDLRRAVDGCPVGAIRAIRG